MAATTDGIHWLGHDSFRIDGTLTVYVDPWKLSASAPPADVILVTHDHFDHLSAPDIKHLAKADTVLVGPAPVTSQVKGVTTVTVAVGDTVTVRGLVVTTVAAYNTDKFRAPGQVFHPKEAGYVGYVFELDGRRIYHAGDTDAIPEMESVACDVALIPVSGVYVMTAEEAAGACGVLIAGAAVPMHYGSVAGSADDAERFSRLCALPVTILPDENG
jgi:L-ascorbate metabolism protein UlaG (beta-lactamase superfamily)